MPASVSTRRYASRICVSTRPGAHAGWNGSGSGTSTWRVRICVMRMDSLRKGAGGTASPGPGGDYAEYPISVSALTAKAMASLLDAPCAARANMLGMMKVW